MEASTENPMDPSADAHRTPRLVVVTAAGNADGVLAAAAVRRRAAPRKEAASARPDR